MVYIQYILERLVFSQYSVTNEWGSNVRPWTDVGLLSSVQTRQPIIFNEDDLRIEPLAGIAGMETATMLDGRSSGRIVEHAGKIYTVKTKGSRPLNSGLTRGEFRQIIDGGALPMTVWHPAAVSEFEGAQLVHDTFYDVYNEIANVPQPAHVLRLDAVNMGSGDVSALEAYPQIVSESTGLSKAEILMQIADLVQRKKSGEAGASLAQLQMVVPGYDVRTVYLLSMIAFEDLDSPFLGDPLFRSLGTSAPKWYGDDMLFSGFESRAHVLNNVYNTLGSAFNADPISVDDFGDDPVQYNRQLAELMHNDNLARTVLKGFIGRTIKLILTMHASGVTFAADYKGHGGSLISRNVTYSGYIMDLITGRQSQVESDLFEQRRHKDWFQFANTLAVMSRFFGKEYWSLIRVMVLDEAMMNADEGKIVTGSHIDQLKVTLSEDDIQSKFRKYGLT